MANSDKEYTEDEANKIAGEAANKELTRIQIEQQWLTPYNAGQGFADLFSLFFFFGISFVSVGLLRALFTSDDDDNGPKKDNKPKGSLFDEEKKEFKLPWQNSDDVGKSSKNKDKKDDIDLSIFR